MANEQTSSSLYADALKVFRRVAPEFKSVPDDDTVDSEGNPVYGVIGYMDLYSDQVSCRRFGSTYAKALAYLTAHKMKMLDLGSESSVNGESGSGGGSDGLGSMSLALRIASASEGETSVSFRGLSSSSGGVSDVDSDLELTVYGMEFLKLRRNAIIPIVSAAEPINNYIPGYSHTADCINKNQGN